MQLKRFHCYNQWRIQDFPWGGGGVHLRHGHFSVKMYVKTKELGPIGGACAGHAPLDPPMIMGMPIEII